MAAADAGTACPTQPSLAGAEFVQGGVYVASSTHGRYPGPCRCPAKELELSPGGFSPGSAVSPGVSSSLVIFAPGLLQRLAAEVSALPQDSL